MRASRTSEDQREYMSTNIIIHHSHTWQMTPRSILKVIAVGKELVRCSIGGSFELGSIGWRGSQFGIDVAQIDSRPEQICNKEWIVGSVVWMTGAMRVSMMSYRWWERLYTNDDGFDGQCTILGWMDGRIGSDDELSMISAMMHYGRWQQWRTMMATMTHYDGNDYMIVHWYWRPRCIKEGIDDNDEKPTIKTLTTHSRWPTWKSTKHDVIGRDPTEWRSAPRQSMMRLTEDARQTGRGMRILGENITCWKFKTHAVLY